MDSTPQGAVRVARDGGSRGWHYIDKAKYDANPGDFVRVGLDGKPDPMDHDGDAASEEPVSETPDGIPTPIPDDWETMHHTKQISLAKALAGDFTAPEGQTMTEKAKSIILAAVTDRANPPAKPA